MQNVIKNYIKEIARNKTKHSRMQLVISMLSLAVMLTVFWQMRIVGISMTGEALCGNLEHTHTQQCLVMKPVCGLEESEGHKHTEECMREAYGCGYEIEHTHTLLCYSDTKADLETASDWEKTIQALSCKPAEDLAMVARSQIGYGESQRNYKVAEDGETKHGYTRYGEWYGNPYGDWNAMFVSFCLRYAEHPAYETLKNSGAETMRLAAADAQLYQAASAAVPYVGDLAFLDKDSNGACETVAIVSGREEGAMTLVEGDCGGVVAENRYSLDNGTILGYALLTPQTMTTEELDDELVDNTVRTVDAEPIQDGNITISFVINNESYTNDPGSNDTHITVNSTEGLSTENLTYTSWESRYKVTGTGSLVSYSIPVNTSLKDSGYGLPSLNIENIDSSNTYSYLSSRSWITSDNMICNEKTVFTENATLSLCLYETGTTCGLNWVCNCDSGGAHSVTNYVSGFDSPTFTWGQSVSDPYIPTAEAVNSMYTGSKYCTAGPDHGMQFKGWYVKNAEGEEIDFAAGVPILQDYVDPYSSGYSVKVYARWEEAEEPETPVTVTATFVNGTETTAKTLNKG